MNFWKEHTALRAVLMICGWKQTGQLGGLGLMLLGVALLLGTLALYNKPFEEPRGRKRR